MEQKYKKGTIVRVIFGHPVWTHTENGVQVQDIRSDTVGKLAVIEGSYFDQYGGNPEYGKDHYSVIYMNGNSEAWKYDKQLEFVEEGSEELIEALKGIRLAEKKKHETLLWIIDNWNNGELNTDSILYLFDRLAYPTSFHKNGEFFVIFTDWQYIGPIVAQMMKLKTEVDMSTYLKENKLPEVYAMQLFCEIKLIQKIKRLRVLKNITVKQQKFDRAVKFRDAERKLLAKLKEEYDNTI